MDDPRVASRKARSGNATRQSALQQDQLVKNLDDKP